MNSYLRTQIWVSTLLGPLDDETSTKLLCADQQVCCLLEQQRLS